MMFLASSADNSPAIGWLRVLDFLQVAIVAATRLSLFLLRSFSLAIRPRFPSPANSDPLHRQGPSSLPDSSCAPELPSLLGFAISLPPWLFSSSSLSFPTATISLHLAPTLVPPAGATLFSRYRICSSLFLRPLGNALPRARFTSHTPASAISSSPISFLPAFPSSSFSWDGASPKNNSSSLGWRSPLRSFAPPSASSSPTANNNASPGNSIPPNWPCAVPNTSWLPLFAGAPTLSALTFPRTDLTSTSTRVSLVSLD